MGADGGDCGRVEAKASVDGLGNRTKLCTADDYVTRNAWYGKFQGLAV